MIYSFVKNFNPCMISDQSNDRINCNGDDNFHDKLEKNNYSCENKLFGKNSDFQPDMVPILQNVVATVNLNCKLDLKSIALHARNAEYNPKKFAAVIMRIREPKTTALIFASGKMVVTGAKSEKASRIASQRYSKIIQKLGFSVYFDSFTVQNIVSSCDLKFPIKLEGLAYAHSNYCSYEPELFPGLIYRMVKPKIVLLIFVSGKIVLTGAKKREDIFEAFENIYPVLTQYRKI